MKDVFIEYRDVVFKFFLINRNGKEVCCLGYKWNVMLGLCDSMYYE